MEFHTNYNISSIFSRGIGHSQYIFNKFRYEIIIVQFMRFGFEIYGCVFAIGQDLLKFI